MRMCGKGPWLQAVPNAAVLCSVAVDCGQSVPTHAPQQLGRSATLHAPTQHPLVPPRDLCVHPLPVRFDASQAEVRNPPRLQHMTNGMQLPTILGLDGGVVPVW